MSEISSEKRSFVDYSDILDFTEPPPKKHAVEGQNGVAAEVASHYNKLPEKGKAARSESRIFFMRNFNNWIKSNLIAEFLEKVRTKNPKINVLDLGCGKGGDLLKWKNGDISKLVGVDVADVSIKQARDRYQTLRKQSHKLFDAEFHCVDCCKDSIMSDVKDQGLRFHLTSCQFVYHYSFDTYRRAEAMLSNACRFLEVGGFFVGTMPNANEIMKRLKLSDSGDEFGNEVFKVKMTSPVQWPKGPLAAATEPPPPVVPIFGAEYNFLLEEVVDLSEYLVHFGTFKKMAEKHGMKLVYAKRFPDYAKQVLEFDKQSRALMQRMNALEGYPAEEDKKLVSSDPYAYAHAEEHVNAVLAKKAAAAPPVKEEKMEAMDASVDGAANETGEGAPDKPKLPNVRVGTLSKPEWEAVTLYMVFAFQKIAQPDY